MATFYTILTDVGQAKLANAIALGQTIEITELAVGDGNGSLPTPETSRTALVNEVRRAPINLSEVDDQNPNWVVVEQVLPPDVGGWTIREIGVFDVEGDLIGYGNYPETYKPVLAEGSSRTQTIRFVMEVSDTEAVTLKVDPSVVLATRGYADDLMAQHEASRNHPAATEAEQGMARIATQTEVDAGTDDVKFVTPKKLKGWVKQATESVLGLIKVATQAQVDAGTDDTRAVTPKKLRWGFSFSAGNDGYIALPSWMGGVIIQWANKSMAYDTGFVNFSLPIAFTSSPYSAACLDVGSSTNTLVAWKANFTDNASINIRWESVLQETTTTKAFFVIVIGK